MASHIYRLEWRIIAQCRIASVWVYVVPKTWPSVGKRFMRRAIDLLVAIFSLTLLLPIFLFIIILINIDSKGPIFYTTQMVGQSGKVFSLFRFRTMSDGQLTRVGKFIRNFSLDHLPMLINLLQGDLTLIGPRPMEVHIVDLNNPVWQKYFQAKPGLFNYAVLKLGKAWTLSRTINPELNQELELEYLDKRFLKSDLKLFIKSLRALIASKGNIKARSEPDVDVKDTIRKVS
jgi:lipopolysaccharide/colanic/teichoic acid biosynthesis glycosyltransferase